MVGAVYNRVKGRLVQGRGGVDASHARNATRGGSIERRTTTGNKERGPGVRPSSRFLINVSSRGQGSCIREGTNRCEQVGEGGGTRKRRRAHSDWVENRTKRNTRANRQRRLDETSRGGRRGAGLARGGPRRGREGCEDVGRPRTWVFGGNEGRSSRRRAQPGKEGRETRARVRRRHLSRSRAQSIFSRKIKRRTSL